MSESTESLRVALEEAQVHEVPVSVMLLLNLLEEMEDYLRRELDKVRQK